jgi:hypothetical protein
MRLQQRAMYGRQHRTPRRQTPQPSKTPRRQTPSAATSHRHSDVRFRRSEKNTTPWQRGGRRRGVGRPGVLGRRPEPYYAQRGGAVQVEFG